MKAINFETLVCIFSLLICCENSFKPSDLKDFKAPYYFGLFELPPSNPLTQEGVELGRMLFYDKRISANYNVSCATCHQQKKAFSDGRAFSIGTSGKLTAKSSMALSNLLWGTKHFFWDGRVSSLEEQALIPIENPDEMGLTIDEAIRRLENISTYDPMFKAAFGDNKITSERIAFALASFQRTLISANSRYDKFLRGELQFSEEELLGKQLFMTHPDPTVGLRGGNCGDCHSQFLTGGFNTGYDGFKNNGLDANPELENGLAAVTGKMSDRGKFKVPSLRNIAITAPYMHDGRFGTLEEVLDHYDHGIKDSETLDPLMRQTSNNPVALEVNLGFHMTAAEKKAILIFLETLTDEEFIYNKEFTDPHY
jgi:cytochrome c peroxidase